MLEKIKVSFGRLTVKIAVGAAIAALLSQYLTWLTDGRHTQSLAQAFAEKPDYFVGFPFILFGGTLWVAVCFLLNHPKLSLVGLVPLQLIWLAMLMTASDYGLSLGAGFFLFIAAMIVCVVMVFKTKKIKTEFNDFVLSEDLHMEALMPILLIFILGGFFLYNPIRRKWSGIIGVGGSYLLATGMILVMGLIGAIFSASIRESMEGGVAAWIFYIVLALLTIAYLVYVMLTRCTTMAQRIMLPFVVLIIAFGWATRMMASIFLHMPMESGNKEEETEFPKFIYDTDDNPWECINNGLDNANYYCQKTGETRMFYISDFDMGAPSGFYRK